MYFNDSFIAQQGTSTIQKNKTRANVLSTFYRKWFSYIIHCGLGIQNKTRKKTRKIAKTSGIMTTRMNLFFSFFVQWLWNKMRA